MSIRLRLFLVLLLATAAVWSGAALWTRASAEARIERVLDARLSEAARMVASLMADGRVAVADAGGLPDALASTAPAGQDGYEHRLSCQIWSLEPGGDRLVSRSEGAPAGRLGTGDPGFGTAVVDGEAWRVFTVEEPRKGVRITVGDTMAMRANLAGEVMAALLGPLALVVPALALLLWWGVGQGLAPLDRLAGDLTRRPAADLSPLPAVETPRELRPLIGALDSLMERLATLREAERSFTTFAAHELKTPLAGLRMQAQVAAHAPDAAARDRALAQVERAVDRTDRMVRQLLDLAAVEAGGPGEESVPLAVVLADTVQDVAVLAEARGIRLRTHGAYISTQANCARPALLRAALRNLVENAVAASPPDGTVIVTVEERGGRLLIRVRDEGPGIPAAEVEAVRRRFVRGRGAQGAGSGLGLAIVEEAAGRLGGLLAMGPARPTGWEATLDLLATGDLEAPRSAVSGA